MRKPSVDNWIADRPGSDNNGGDGHRFNSLRAAATIHESLSLSASPDDSLVIDHDSLKNADDDDRDDTPTMAMDSLQCPNQLQQPPPPIPSVNFQQPDSLSYGEEHTNAKNNGDFFDSMEEAALVTDNSPPKPPQGMAGKKKLIIPYATDSYSSNKSLSTSQEDDDDDDEDDDDEEEEEEDDDVDEESSVVKDVPIEMARPQTTMMSKRPVSASPALAGAPVSGHRLLPNPPNNLRRRSSGSNPDLRLGLCPNLNGPFPAGKRLPDHPTITPAAPVVLSVSPQQQSLMRMATERMKRKFLGGWN